MSVCVFEIPGVPVSQPRQVRSDKWKPRECVKRYRAWRDLARLCAPKTLPAHPSKFEVLAYLPIPGSWSEKKRLAAKGQAHRAKPDADNIIKAAIDALYAQDSCIHQITAAKLYDDGGGPRLVVKVS